MVKNLANALMAEISKMKSSSSKGATPSSEGNKTSSTASSSFLKMKSSSKGAAPSPGGKKASFTASCSSVKRSTLKSGLDKNGASSSVKTKVCVAVCVCIHVRFFYFLLFVCLTYTFPLISVIIQCAKSSPPTMVRLLRVQSSLSRNDLVSALEHYGKIKSFLMFRSKQEVWAI